jgi:hypothetical protein
MMHQVFPYLQAQQQGQQTTYAWNRQVQKRAPSVQSLSWQVIIFMTSWCQLKNDCRS